MAARVRVLRIRAKKIGCKVKGVGHELSWFESAKRLIIYVESGGRCEVCSGDRR